MPCDTPHVVCRTQRHLSHGVTHALAMPVSSHAQLARDLPPPFMLILCETTLDEPRFYEIMESAGWPGWNDEKLQPWLPRILPQGWFMIVHAESDEIVATAMALQDQSEFGESGGELGWLACAPVHRGKGLGLVASTAVTSRLLRAGYRHIHLYTEHWRLAAIKSYLKLGYVPLLDKPMMVERWRAICEKLQWPFTPERWKTRDLGSTIEFYR